MAQEDDEAVDLIIVTAQKRTETITEIPMSITVLGGELLERQRADNFQELVKLVPGFSLTTETRGVTRITLRGINTGGVASTVGVYVNDVPFGSSTGLANGSILSGDFDTFDLARVEVLRGPQGTLYGASSLGGTIRYITNQANTNEFEARAQVSVESVEDGDIGYSFTGVVNAPLSDQFAVRASGFYRFDDGFIDSIGNNPIPSFTDPMNNVVDGTRVASDINDLDTFGGRVSALWQPSDQFSLDLTLLMQNIESGDNDLVDADAVTLQPLNSNNVQSSYHPEYTDIEYRVYSATLDWDFGAASLQSVTSYGTFEQNFQNDFAVPFDLAATLTFLFGDPATQPLSSIQRQTTATDKFTQELRFVSPDNDSFEWLVGLYYTEEDSAIAPQTFFVVDAGTENIVDLPIVIADATVSSDYEELALFANATWHITPNFELSFGARASDDEQSASQVLDGILAGGFVESSGNSSDSPFTWSISPRYALSDDSSIYLRVATGYRPGGPNVLPAVTPPGVPGFYDSDRLTSYELGFKAAALGGVLALDIAAYFLDWEDIQLFVQVNNVGINANGGTAESRGLEFTASLYPTDGLTISLNGAYTDAELTQDTDPLVGGLDGDPLSYVPEWSYGLSGDYEWSVLGDSMAYVGANVSYTGDRPAGFSNRDGNGNIREADSYTTLDLRAGIDTGRWTFEVYGSNLTDEQGVNSINAPGSLPNGAVGLSLIRPRTYGLSVGVRY